MSETNDHGPARAPQAHKQTICPAVLDGHRPAFGISSQWIERVSTRSGTCLVIKAGCMRMAMPVSTACSVKVKPRKWPAWPTSDASLSMCLPHKVPPLPRRPSSGLRNCMVWKNRQGGQSPEARAALRQENAKPIFDDLEEWLRDQLPKISGKSPLAKAIRYALGRMPKTRPYLDNGFLGAGQQHRRTRHEARRHRPQELDVCRITTWWKLHGHRLHSDRNRQTQRR